MRDDGTEEKEDYARKVEERSLEWVIGKSVDSVAVLVSSVLENGTEDGEKESDGSAGGRKTS